LRGVEWMRLRAEEDRGLIWLRNLSERKATRRCFLEWWWWTLVSCWVALARRRAYIRCAGESFLALLLLLWKGEHYIIKKQ
jgi:hypothetical protein